MIVIVDDMHQTVSLCGLDRRTFMRLAAAIQAARECRKPAIQSVAAALHLSVRWRLDSKSGTISLVKLSWDEVFALNAIILGTLSAGPRIFKNIGLGQLIDGIDAAVEMAIRDSQPFRLA